MGLLEREYMRDTPRVHVGESHRPDVAAGNRDLSWVSGRPRPQRGSRAGWIALALLLALAAIMATAVLTGMVTFTMAH